MARTLTHITWVPGYLRYRGQKQGVGVPTIFASSEGKPLLPGAGSLRAGAVRTRADVGAAAVLRTKNAQGAEYDFLAQKSG